MTNINQAGAIIKLGMIGGKTADQIAGDLDSNELLADDHHSVQELYDYRMVYNALIFNEWELQGRHDVHKSWRHSDGEECFGGGWFIVCAITRWGLISNHYPAEHWELFDIPEREIPVEYDGHTPEEALYRLMNTVRDYL